MESLSPPSVLSPSPAFSSKNDKLESPITLHEFESCIKNKDTTPGYDNISFSMIKHLPTRAKIILVNLLNKFLFCGFVPNQWREIGIIPIPKPGRDQTLSSSLRPISLMSCISKNFHLIFGVG